MGIAYLKQPIRDISGVTANAASTVSIRVPCDGRRVLAVIPQLYFTAGTQTVAGAHTAVTMIRCLRDTKVIQKFSGTERRDLNLFNGTQFDVPAVLPNAAPGVAINIPFADIFRDSDADKVAPGWRTDQMQAMSIELDVASAAATAVVASCLFDYPGKSTAPQMLTRIERVVMNASGSSFDFVLPFKRGYLQQITLYPDSGNSTTPASKVTLRAGGIPIHEMSRAAQTAADQLNGCYPLATGRSAYCSDIVLDADGLLSRAVDLSTAGETTLSIESTATMSGTLVGLFQIVDVP